MTVFCDHCGTSIEETANFCRVCGIPTPLSEATTKRFDEQAEVRTPTSPVASSLTGPAYLAPVDLPAAPQTNDLRQKTHRRNVIILVSMFAVMIFALAGLLLFLNTAPGRPGGITQGPPPGLTQPPPPPPPPPPGIDGRAKIDESLIYPGSQQTMSIGEKSGKSVLQLHSDDGAKKVAEWYSEKLKTPKTVTLFGQTILKAGDLHVLIMGGDDGAEIIITRGGEDLTK